MIKHLSYLGDNKVLDEINSNVIELKRETKYRYSRISHKIKRISRDGVIDIEEYILIVLQKRSEYGMREIIDPLSLYVLRAIPSKGLPKPNTQIARADLIISFLNYVFFESSKRKIINNITEIDFEVGEEYLNSYRFKAVTKKTVLEKKRKLLELFKYLIQKDILEKYKFNYQTGDIYEIQENNHIGIIHPFSNIYLPTDRSSNILHDLPNELIISFIDTAVNYTPQIAFGVYCQFFGGLRCSEVVNISSRRIRKKGPFGQFGLIITLIDSKFRVDLKTPNASGSVKSVRKQAIYPYKGELLSRLYKNHIENYMIEDNSGAMFWLNNGKPMSVPMYRYYFNKLKTIFISLLLKSDDIYFKNYGVDLQSQKWSTHIGRGVFSNMIAEAASNINEIRQARGDKTFDGSIPYISNTKKMAVELANNHEDMWELLIEDIKKEKNDT